MLLDEFARLVLPLGTTAVVADPHEIANVLGTDGVHWLLDAADGLPLDVYFMASSCVPASRKFESAAARAFTIGDLEGPAATLARARGRGDDELPGVVSGSSAELEKLRLASHVDGHARVSTGKELNAYAAAGIESDHEAATVEEGRERLRAGMWLLIREASGARNLESLLPLALEYGPSRLAFCTDDREPEHVADDGHINAIVRRAVELGLPPEDAIVMASLNPASYHGLAHLGAIAPGYQADVLVLDDLESFTPALVLKRGRPVAEIASTAVPEWAKRTVHVGALGDGDFSIPWPGGHARVIGLVPGQISTTSLVAEPASVNGRAVADTEADLAKVVVLERHLQTGRIGRGFVHGFGLASGAFGSTVAHDAHNLIVVGVDDASMLAVARRLRELGGGSPSPRPARSSPSWRFRSRACSPTGRWTRCWRRAGRWRRRWRGWAWASPNPSRRSPSSRSRSSPRSRSPTAGSSTSSGSSSFRSRSQRRAGQTGPEAPAWRRAAPIRSAGVGWVKKAT